MNWAELTTIQRLYNELQARSANVINLWDAPDREAAVEAQIVAIERFSTAVLAKWPEIDEVLTEAVPAPAAAKVARQFAQLVVEEMANGADSVVVSIDKQKHGL